MKACVEQHHHLVGGCNIPGSPSFPQFKQQLTTELKCKVINFLMCLQVSNFIHKAGWGEAFPPSRQAAAPNCSQYLLYSLNMVARDYRRAELLEKGLLGPYN